MKILLCADDKSANTLAWVKGFRELGAEVIIASARAEKSTGGIVALGTPSLPARLNFIFGAGKLREVISKEKPDILIGYRVTSYGYLCASSGFHPLVLAAQNEQITYLPKPNPIRRKVLEYFARKAIGKADLIHAWGDNMLPRLKELGADEKKILVMHRGIDLDLFKPSVSKPAGAPVFISSRSLFPEYKINRIIEAFVLLLKKIPDACLKITGEGPEKIALMNLVQSLGISEEIKFSGRLSPQEVAGTLQNSDIYVSIIESEGVSSSLLESCACGVYPIVTDMPASRALIESGSNGTLIKPDISISDLAEIMIRTAGNIEMRENAVKMNHEMIKKKFNFRNNTGKFIDAYKELAIQSRIHRKRDASAE
ncbi:MAG: glycosyltransferase [Victivallales bacterium]